MSNPKFNVGHRAGSLTVIKIEGHEWRNTSKKQWWYTVVCDCQEDNPVPETESITQQQVIHRSRCAKCRGTGERRKKTNDVITMLRPGNGIPDFARIKL